MKKYTIAAACLISFFATSVSAQGCVRDLWGQVYCQQGYQVDSGAQQRRDQQVDRFFQQQEQDRQRRQEQESQQRIQDITDGYNQSINREQQHRCNSGRITLGC
jgi:hypothetical protein